MEVIKNYKDFRSSQSKTQEQEKPHQKSDKQQTKTEEDKPARKSDNSAPQKAAGASLVPDWKVY
jgi:outer membrane biosynthesis protein TonB